VRVCHGLALVRLPGQVPHTLGHAGTIVRVGEVERPPEEHAHHRDEDVGESARDGEEAADAHGGLEELDGRMVLDRVRRGGERDVPVAARHAEDALEDHRHGQDDDAHAEEIGLDFRQPPEGHTLPEDQRQHVIGDGHERERGAPHDGGMEVAGDAERVVGDDVDLLRTDGDARDAPEEAEDHHRQRHPREARIAPGRLLEPLEGAARVAAQPLAHLDAGRHREAVHHAREHGEVHGVARVPHLPGRPHAGIDEEVVRRGHRDEEHVEDEGHAAHLLVHHHAAHGQPGEQVPDRHVGGHVDLLGRMAEAPPHHAVDLRVHGHETERPEERGDIDGRPVQERDHRDDGGRERPEAHEGDRALVGALTTRHDEAGEEERGHHERPHREEDDAEVVERMGLERRVRREEHVGPARHHGGVHAEHAENHQREGSPAEPRAGQPGTEEHGPREVQHGHLEEDDEEDEHVEAVQGEEAIEEVGRQEMNGLPSRHDDAEGGDEPDEEVHHRDHRVRLDERLGVPVHREPGDLAHAARARARPECLDDRGHTCPSSPTRR
jgi:hypothetical protein